MHRLGLYKGGMATAVWPSEDERKHFWPHLFWHLKYITMVSLLTTLCMGEEIILVDGETIVPGNASSHQPTSPLSR